MIVGQVLLNQQRQMGQRMKAKQYPQQVDKLDLEYIDKQAFF